MTTPIALITGASSGIGAEFARIFSSEGHRVALVARRADQLHALAASLKESRGGPPLVIPCDLAEPNSGDTIAQALAAAGCEVEHLVNNAGFGLVGRAMALDRTQQLQMIDLNVRALTDLTLRFAPDIVRNKGGILNVASIASFMPGPGMAVYYASKAFVLSFSEALYAELKPQGVRVCALCPGPVPTGFQERANMRPEMRKTPIDQPADRVALAGYRGLMKGRRVVLPGLVVRMMPVWVRLAPRGMLVAGIAKALLQR